MGGSRGGELRELAREIDEPGLEADACVRTANTLYAASGPGRSERLERMIELLERACSIFEANPDVAESDARAEVFLALGVAFGSRVEGDLIANRERAIALQRRVLELTSIESNGRVWAMAETNLGLALADLAVARHAGMAQDEAGSAARSAEVDEAIDHFHAALRWRTFERNPLDWGYTQINLGVAFQWLARWGQSSKLQPAVEHYGNAVRAYEAAEEPGLRAWALRNRSSANLELADLNQEDERLRESLLSDAERDVRTALETRGLDEAPLEAGRTWRQYANVLVRRGYSQEVVAAYRHALEGLTPQTAPRESRDGARDLGQAAADAGDWPVAAEAWEAAAEAAASALEARATSEGRFDEIRENLNLFRWAAYALTRVGSLERAVEVLELGRARELQTWLQGEVVDFEQVRHLDPGLCDRYIELRSQLDQIERQERAGIGVPSVEAAHVAEGFASTVEEIRELPGLKGFRKRPDFNEIAEAVPPEEALAYPVTSPHGSAVLVVRGGPGSRVELVDLPNLTSGQIIKALAPVDAADRTANGYLVTTGYLVAQAGASDRLDAEIDELSDLLGLGMLKPLADSLERAGVSTLCIVPIGLLGRLPLHALAWEEESGSRCLLDACDVVFAPSAFARNVCLRRASEHLDARRLVVVGNPSPHPVPLQHAEFEAKLVAATFDAERVESLIGPEATKDAIRRALQGATHVHLACHGQAAVTPKALDAGLSLAHEEVLSAGEILDLDDFAPRLVVTSACETGIIPGYEEADESLAFSTVLVGAGAAGAVGSLWAIDDYATSLLMSRFYELLGNEASGEPAAALRQAQIWLRDLTSREEDAYLQHRPSLREHRGRAAPRSDSRAGQLSPDRPFDAPSYWAAFVFCGA